MAGPFPAEEGGATGTEQKHGQVSVLAAGPQSAVKDRPNRLHRCLKGEKSLCETCSTCANVQLKVEGRQRRYPPV